MPNYISSTDANQLDAKSKFAMLIKGYDEHAWQPTESCTKERTPYARAKIQEMERISAWCEREEGTLMKANTETRRYRRTYGHALSTVSERRTNLKQVKSLTTLSTKPIIRDAPRHGPQSLVTEFQLKCLCRI